MTVKTKNAIKEHLLNHIHSRGGHYSGWYIGIAKNPKERLFNDHNVQEVGGHWVYEQCASDTIAREIEKEFLELDFDGGGGGGDHETIFIYAYKKTTNTEE
jgi:hypothetical protein